MHLIKFSLLYLTLIVNLKFVNDALANSAEPSPREAGYDLMQYLADKGLHDIDDESWNFYGQMTYINSTKNGFTAPYTNFNNSGNSLSPIQEGSFTGTVTLFMGLKSWKGGEFYFVPEMISERPLSGLKGLGGAIQNFELQKNGTEEPTFYISRGFFKQTWGLGGGTQKVASDPMQLGTTEDNRRFVFRFGEFSILDFFDKNTYSGDLRKQFNNMAFLTYAAYDFAADARGYTWGAVAELFWDDWAIRFGHILAPKNPNQLALDIQPFKYFGQQIELEHRHIIHNQPGAIRILGYRNQENLGRFADAISAYNFNPTANNAANCQSFNYGSNDTTAPDLCWARKLNVKMGIGLNMEQQIYDDIGLSFRGMYSDGQTEEYSYTSTDRSLSLGAIMGGKRWARPNDSIGIGYAAGFLSKVNIQYLANGGIDSFIGDGKINYSPEQVLDSYYSLNIWNETWITADYQHITNPAYNADRGPVDIYSVKVHMEF